MSSRIAIRALSRFARRASVAAAGAMLAVAAGVFGSLALADGTPDPWGVRITSGATVTSVIGEIDDRDADDFVFQAVRGQTIAITVKARAVRKPGVALRPEVTLLPSDGTSVGRDDGFVTRLKGRTRAAAFKADATDTYKVRVTGGFVDRTQPAEDSPRTTGTYTLALKLGSVATGKFAGAVPDVANQLRFAIPGRAGAVITTTLRWRGTAPLLRGLNAPGGAPVSGFGANAKQTRTSIAVHGFRLGRNLAAGDYDLAFDTSALSPPTRISLVWRVRLPKARNPLRTQQHRDEPYLLTVSPPTGGTGTILTLSGGALADRRVPLANVFRAYVGRHRLTNVSAVNPLSPTQLTGTVPTGVPLGTYDVVVETSTGQVAVLEDAFEVVADPPDPDPDPKTPSATNYPLEITNIKASGAGGLDPMNRIFRAYPGLPYVIRAAVMGGSYPYTFSLTNAPAGMTVDTRTGEVSWPNPAAGATPTITVTDGALAQVAATWSIDVTTTGFHFVDAVNGQAAGAGGLGTLAQPWRTIADMRANAAAGGIVYFRAGTYTPAGLPTTGSSNPPETRVEFQHASHPVIWIGYPGDARPVIDFGHTSGATTTPRFRIGSVNVWLDGLESTRSHIMAFQITTNPNGQGAMVRRCSMHDGGPGIDGSNAAFLMTSRTGGHGFLGVGMAVMDNEFHTFTDLCALKSYDQDRLLVADNVIHDNAQLDELDAAIAIKGDHGRWEVRGNRIYDVLHAGIGGNMHAAQQGEIRFNYVQCTDAALSINQDGVSGPVFISRNTLVGRVWMRNTDTADGPFTFARNVIVSADTGTPAGSRIYHESVTDPARVVVSDNLTGAPADGLVDANGDLTPAFEAYLGTHGH